MSFSFYKYQGTGNDFIIIDNRTLFFDKTNTDFIKSCCDRKFGIGADGLILLENHPKLDFRMVYYNADGNESSMCGNGGRCIVHFAKYLGIIKKVATFEAIDGIHDAKVISNRVISLKMNDVNTIEHKGDAIFLDTGSPHHVTLVDDLQNTDVYGLGKKLRHNLYGDAGANINFVAQQNDNTFGVRTYERGVENETLSCGTGVTAVALAMFEKGYTQHQKIVLETPGGTLKVSFAKTAKGYQNIYLTAEATLVFKGDWI